MQEDRLQRITSGILGMILLAVVLFSAFFMTYEKEHDCTGEHCPVCACIHQCEKILRSFQHCVESYAVFLMIPLLLLYTMFFYESGYQPLSPVLLKVRLDH